MTSSSSTIFETPLHKSVRRRRNEKNYEEPHMSSADPHPTTLNVIITPSSSYEPELSYSYFTLMSVNCSDAEQYADSPLLNIVLFMQISFSFLTLLFIVMNLPLPCIKRSAIVVHRNLKIILFNAIILYSMNAICLVVTPTIYEINFFTYKNPCDLYVKTWRCLLMRIPINLSKVGFTLMHLVIFLERGIATVFPSKYESLNNRSIGIITAITMWIIILGSNAFIFSNEDWNASKSYCVLTSNQNKEKQTVLHYILLVVDVLVTLADILLVFANSKNFTRFTKTLGSNYLSRTYQLDENKRTMRIILPMSIIHSGFFILFLASSLSVRQFAVGLGTVNYNILIEVTNVITCIYTAVVALAFLRLRKRLAKTSMTRIVPIVEEADLYHKTMQNLWK